MRISMSMDGLGVQICLSSCLFMAVHGRILHPTLDVEMWPMNAILIALWSLVISVGLPRTADTCQRCLPMLRPRLRSPSTMFFGYDGHDADEAKATENYNLHGALYNWQAVQSSNVCPNGWHVSSDEDWKDVRAGGIGSRFTFAPGRPRDRSRGQNHCIPLIQSLSCTYAKQSLGSFPNSSTKSWSGRTTRKNQ